MDFQQGKNRINDLYGFSMIEYKNINLSFAEKSIFKNFNAKISSGSFVSFSGPSGRGKSSLLKLVQGYVVPDSGSVLIDNEIVNHNTVYQLRKKNCLDSTKHQFAR